MQNKERNRIVTLLRESHQPSTLLRVPWQGLFPASGPKAKATRAEKALEALSAEPRTLLVDIRSTGVVKTKGSPVLGKVAGKTIVVPYTKVRTKLSVALTLEPSGFLW